MDRFTFVVLLSLFIIFLFVLIYFLGFIIFDKLKGFFINSKSKKFIFRLNNIFDNLNNDIYPNEENIKKLILNINKDVNIKNLFYKMSYEYIKESKDIVSKKEFFLEVNKSIINTIDFNNYSNYSKDLDNFIISLSTHLEEDERIDKFLINCISSKSKRIRLSSLNVIALRGEVRTFTKSIIMAGEKSSDFTYKELINSIENFKDSKLKKSIIKKLKEETDNIKLKVMLKDYLVS